MGPYSTIMQFRSLKAANRRSQRFILLTFTFSQQILEASSSGALSIGSSSVADGSGLNRMNWGEMAVTMMPWHLSVVYSSRLMSVSNHDTSHFNHVANLWTVLAECVLQHPEDAPDFVAMFDYLEVAFPVSAKVYSL